MALVKNTIARGFAVLAFLVAVGAPADHAYAGNKKPVCKSIPQVTGKASVYSDSLDGGPTSSGEALQLSDMTAAHPCLPFGTIVQVTDVNTGKTIRVRINDRGPFIKGRIIDITTAAMRELGHQKKGLWKVALNIEKLGP